MRPLRFTVNIVCLIAVRFDLHYSRDIFTYYAQIPYAIPCRALLCYSSMETPATQALTISYVRITWVSHLKERNFDRRNYRLRT